MNVQIIKGAEVNRPATTPITSSLLDHATVVENARFGLRNNDGLWPSYNCIDTMVPTPICPDPLAEKTFSTAGWAPAFEFAMHGGVQCKAVGLDTADMKSEIARVFAANEGKGVEMALMENGLIDPGSEIPLGWNSPVDLTPGTGVPLSVALALVEGYAARVYAGVPTLHMSRAAASMLNERIVWKDGLAFTRLGSKVAVGGGYDDPDTLESGLWPIYATGEVYVERSDEVFVQTHVIPGTTEVGSDASGTLEDNNVLALAERMYRIGVDCFAAVATGTVWT
jgi:hypothetical protein